VRARLQNAETLPPACYVSQDFYRLEVEKMFSRCWNFFGRVDRVPNPGDYFTVDYMDWSVVIVRGKDGVIRAFSNSCRHRGTRILDGNGNSRAFTCPYHSWVYDLDGRLRSCAGMEGVEQFNRSDYALKQLRLETWGGFIFINFSGDAESLPEYLGDFPEQFASYDCDNLVTVRRIEYDLACNWKVFIENAMEEYHVPHVHQHSISLLTVGDNIIPAIGNWDAIREKHKGTRALLEEDQGKAFPPIKTLVGPPAEGTHFVCLYPSTMLGMTKDCVWYLELQPRGPQNSKLIFGACFPRETVACPDFEERSKYYFKRWSKSIEEDNNISERQQAGLQSRLTVSGRYSLHEQLVHHIANWVLDWVLDEKGQWRLNQSQAH